MADAAAPTLGLIAVRYFFLLTPFFLLSSFLALTRDEPDQRRRLAIRTTVAIALTAMVLYFIGEWLFAAMGITLDAFRIGAGGLLFLSAVALVRGGGEQRPRDPAQDIAVVPLAIPIAIGPATTGALMVMGAEQSGGQRIVGCLGVLLAVAATGAVLLLGDAIERLLGQRGIVVVSKLTGLILAAMAAQLVFTGARAFLH